MNPHATMTAPHIRRVAWRDLVKLSRAEITLDLLLSLPWLLLSWVCAAWGWYIPALAFSFFFFLTAIRQVHDAFHNAHRFPRWAMHLEISLLGMLMLGSMHAVQRSHLRHHTHCLGEGDLEGSSAMMPWWKALLFGPIFTIHTHVEALRNGKPALRRWVVLELLLTAAIITAAFLQPYDFLKYHVLTMLFGHCLTAFFLVWTVHHDCDGEHQIARTQRGWLKNFLTYNMFFHVEHHLFPAVPTRRLPQLAARLDEAAPELKDLRVF